jgi:hypothetical protein
VSAGHLVLGSVIEGAYVWKPGQFWRGQDGALLSIQNLGLILQRHLVMSWPWALCQGEGGSLSPVPSGGLLGHHGDCDALCVDGQVRLDGLLGGAQVFQEMSVADGQVGDDVVELAFERGECGKAW